MDLELKGKTVLITGGSKGIGRSCANVLAAVAIFFARPASKGPGAAGRRRRRNPPRTKSWMILQNERKIFAPP